MNLCVFGEKDCNVTLTLPLKIRDSATQKTFLDQRFSSFLTLSLWCSRGSPIKSGPNVLFPNTSSDTQVQGGSGPNRPQQRTAGWSRCEAFSPAAQRAQLSEWKKPAARVRRTHKDSARTAHSVLGSVACHCKPTVFFSSFFLFLMLLSLHELLITQQARYVGIPRAGMNAE